MTSRRKDKGKRLSVLTDAEKFALYGLPDFDEGQQLEYLSLTAEELALATSRPGILAQIYCILQTGYFKAKHAFFHFSPKDVESDFDFVVQRYFREISLTDKTITVMNIMPSASLLPTSLGIISGPAPLARSSMPAQHRLCVVILLLDLLPPNLSAG
jgi:hypothetical protein